MKTLRLLLVLAPMSLASACASSPFDRTSYPSGDQPAEARAYADFMLARFAAMTNDPGMAARHYALAMPTAPQSTDVAERAVFSALLAGDYGIASGMARRAAETGSTAGLVHLTLAVDAIGRGKPDAAYDIIEDSNLTFFNRTIGRNLQAWALLEDKGPKASEARLKQSLTGDPRLDNITLHTIGFIQMAAREDAEALRTFEAIWATGARLAAGAEAYAELLAASGDAEKARKVLRQFRDEVGYNAALADLERRLEVGEAVAPRRLKIREGAALALYLPASALMFQTEDDIASVYFVLALALDPNLHQARTLRAQALTQGDRPDDALRVLKDVPKSSPFYSGARGQMASILQREDREEEALRVASEAMSANPERGLSLQVADLYRALERYAEAEEILTRIIEVDAAEGRTDWRVIFVRGAARERQARFDLAEADLKRALEMQPENATVLNYLGYSWIDRGINLEEGFDLIRKAVALEPESGQIVDSLGWAHYRLGQYEEAVDYLERAVALEPGDPVLNDHLGDAYWKAGRQKEAGFQWRRALKLDPPQEEREAIELKLKGGIEVDPVSPGATAAP